MLLKDKVVIITGAASARGLGFAITKLPADNDAKVAIISLNGEVSKIAVAVLGEGHLGLVTDVVGEVQIQAAIRQALAKHSRVDVLVSNAGITRPLKLMKVKRVNYDAVPDVSLRGTPLMSQAVIPTIRAQKSGSIVYILSVSAQRGGGIFGGPRYSATKTGALGLTWATAYESGPDNARVNCIIPGLIQTDIIVGKLTDDIAINVLAGTPMSRLGDAVDIARVTLFLGSDLLSYPTDIILDANDGMLIH